MRIFSSYLGKFEELDGFSLTYLDVPWMSLWWLLDRKPRNGTVPPHTFPHNEFIFRVFLMLV